MSKSHKNQDKNKNQSPTIFDTLQNEVMQSDLPEAEKNHRLSMLLKVSSCKVNLMLVGATSSGKSSTINALFNTSVAQVGYGVEPETKNIEKYELGSLTIWDTPGLGDSISEDQKHITNIVRKLSETDENGELLIDLVLVVLDAGTKDLAVSYGVINNTLIPCLGARNSRRILIALNQSDMAMKGRHWNYEENSPEPILKEFLTKKAESVKARIRDATGVIVEPVCYCAGYSDGTDNEPQQNPYNLSKLLYYILAAVPSEKRLVLADNLNAEDFNWSSDDGEADYHEEIQYSFGETLWGSISLGAAKGAEAGGYLIGLPGTIVGGILGTIFGGLGGLIIQPFLKVK
jgi:predicted GTPase